jgi:hypothetical protein
MPVSPVARSVGRATTMALRQLCCSRLPRADVIYLGCGIGQLADYVVVVPVPVPVARVGLTGSGIGPTMCCGVAGKNRR